jgi:hypothetical protein
MSPVEFIIEHVIEEGYNTYSQCNTQTKNIDKGKDLILPEVPEGYQQIIPEHTRR